MDGLSSKLETILQICNSIQEKNMETRGLKH